MKCPASLPLAVAALVLVGAIAAPLAWGSAEHAAEEKPAANPAPASAPASPQGAANIVEEGVLHNAAHGLRFPVPQDYTLRATSTADEIVLSVGSCDECVLRVLVSPGNTDSLETTAGALKRQMASDPSAHILDEQRTRVAREAAYTLVKEEVPDAASATAGSPAPPAVTERILTRYVTFNHGQDKYYLVLRGPSGRFSADEDAFQQVLAKLRFDARH